MYKEYFDSNKTILDFISNIDILDIDKIDNLIKYLVWQKEQHELYAKESLPLEIPQQIFKKKLSAFEYNKHKGILSKYYSRHGDCYIKRNIAINDSDSIYLLNKMILIPGNVAWVKFGFNVGCEFGGFHPAVILKNIGKALIVAPLSSGINYSNNKQQIDVSKVYAFEIRARFTDISRIVSVSVYRVDLKNKIGNVHRGKLNEIKSAIINYWQDRFCIYL